MRANVLTKSSRACALVAGLLALFGASRAYAGPVEQLVEVATTPGKSDSMLVRYINGGGGLFLSTDSGKSWSLQCNSAFLGTGGRVQGPIAVLPDKTILALTSMGVAHADANGCGFKIEMPELTKNIVDFVLHPMDPTKVIAAVSDPMGMSGLVQRGADGQWTAYGAKDALSPVGLRVGMKGSALKIYEVAVKSRMMNADAGTTMTEYVLRVSDDEAKTWQEYPLPADPMMGRPRIRAVDPSNADRFVLLIDRQMTRDDVLVSKDGGKTTTKYMDVDELGGVAFAPDGRVWIGDLGTTSGSSQSRGLYAAASLEAMPTRLPMATYPVQCLGWAEDTKTLYACQRFWFGSVNQMSGELTTTLRFTDVPKFVACPGEDPAMECKAQLCLDYCGPAHFAVAPVCSAYDQPDCGKPVAAMEAEGDGTTTTGTSGTSGSTSAGGTGAAGSSGAVAGAAGSMNVAGQTSAVAGSTSVAGSGATPPAKKDSGCSCSVPGSSEPRRAPVGLALSALAVAVWRRKRAGTRD
jgi:MYXO-CTERM domain-containing protein